MRKTATKLSDIPAVFVSDEMYEVGGRFDVPLLFESYIANTNEPYVFAPCEDFDSEMAGVAPSLIVGLTREAERRFSLGDDCFIYDPVYSKLRSGGYGDFLGLLCSVNEDLMPELVSYAIEFDNPTNDPVLDELVERWDAEGRFEFGDVQ